MAKDNRAHQRATLPTIDVTPPAAAKATHVERKDLLATPTSNLDLNPP